MKQQLHKQANEAGNINWQQEKNGKNKSRGSLLPQPLLRLQGFKPALHCQKQCVFF
jgi:hypothetical protein